MRALQVTLDPFRTQFAPVEGELVPRFKADDFVVFDFKLDTALLAAKAAVGFDEFIWFDGGLEPHTLVVNGRWPKWVFNRDGFGSYRSHYSTFLISTLLLDCH